MSDQASGETLVLLDNSLDSDGRSLLFRDPMEIISATDPDDVAGALGRIDEVVNSGRHTAGFLTYELGYALEPRLAPLMPADRKLPLLWFAVFDEPAVMDDAAVAGWLDENARGGHSLESKGVTRDENAYLKRFDRVKELILAGDLYQINLTFKSLFKLSGSTLSLYRDLRTRQRVAHGAVILTPEFSILSASPELFVSIHDGIIETRPMKGTAARAPTVAEDEDMKSWLAADEKNRAENLMIVDLMRNDLGRIAKIGTVEVPDLFKVETYQTLHQMVSRVRAEVTDGAAIPQLVSALFPPGSVTGAPKIRAMELIRELEHEPRGVYTGAIGMFAPDGSAAFNVAIRTAVIDRHGNGEIGIGSGLVADSVGADEYAECLLKMKFFSDPASGPDADFQLIETLRYTRQDGYWLFGEHMTRLARSAAELGFAVDLAKVRDLLSDIVERRGEPMLRMRLLVSKSGETEVTAVAMTPPNDAAHMSYVISEHRVSSTDRLLAHKTTCRELYDGEHARLTKQLTIDDVLFLNELGELTEGSRTNIFVERDGRLLTPPLKSGLLPGTLRAALIAEGRAVEAVLTPEDLESGDPVYLGNSVRGLLPAKKAE